MSNYWGKGYKYNNNRGGLRQSTIARFDSIQNSWTKLGDLYMARSAHSVIQVDDTFIVVGGMNKVGENGKDVPTESCKLLNNKWGDYITCTTREPEFSRSYHPELMFLP